MSRKIILEGTDGVGKTTTAAYLKRDGVEVFDRDRDVISKYMLFHVDMETRASVYEAYLRENDVLVIFMVNHNREEISQRIQARERISEFDKQANEYNDLYHETYLYMTRRGMTHGKLLLADCTGLSFDDQIRLIKSLIRVDKGAEALTVQGKFVRSLLSSDAVVEAIRSHMDELLQAIPEISDMVGFDHKHPHHHLDVWEHTLEALRVSEKDLIVRMVLLLHDIGKPHVCIEGEVRHFYGHAERSALMGREILARLGYGEDEIERLCHMILRHDTALTREDVLRDPVMSEKLLEVQRCDTLAHSPEKLARRLDYLSSARTFFEDIE